MTHRTWIPVLFVLATAACASTSDTQEGWTGAGTVPFDRAKDRCEAEAAPVNDADARKEAMALCMAKYGWHRQ